MDILTAIANFVMATLSHDPAKIIVGRANYEMIDFSDDIIIIDNLITSVVGQTDTYDRINENMSYGINTKSIITITFYGDDALTNASDFIALCKSEVANDTAFIQGFSYKYPSKMTNTGILTGTQRSEKYEVEMAIYYTHEKKIDTLSIETAELSFLVND